MSVENEMQASMRIGDKGFISLSQFCVQECSIIYIWAFKFWLYYYVEYICNTLICALLINY